MGHHRGHQLSSHLFLRALLHMPRRPRAEESEGGWPRPPPTAGHDGAATCDYATAFSGGTGVASDVSDERETGQIVTPRHLSRAVHLGKAL